MDATQPSPYRELELRFRRLSLIGEATGVLHWDMSVMMPDGGAGARTEQLATLAALRHEMITDARVADLLDRAEDEAGLDGAGLDEWQRANLREMRRRWVHDAAIETALVEALSRAASACEMTWRTARAEDNFALLAPSLKEVLRLVREIASAKAESLGCAPYEALMDRFEPGLRLDAIDPLFEDLQAFLPGFLARVIERQQKAGEPAPLKGPFPVSAQRDLAVKLMGLIGFNFDGGRLDESLHPFCGGVPEDVRITTRYREEDFAEGLMAVLHETGHALYEIGLPRDWRNQPVGMARGMAVHESQSLIMEMQACRSREFVTFAAPLMREVFGGDGPAWDEDNIHRLYTRVAPGLIRVDADEVTYPLHVILRYRLERAMIEGTMEIDDLQGAWNDGMKDLLVIVPPDDRSGCLQDIHWPDGAWGYFPTYTVGAVTAAQMFQAARTADPSLLEAIGQGDFGPLLSWLRANVHGRGSLLSVDALLTEATGRTLATQAFKAHLEARYLG